MSRISKATPPTTAPGIRNFSGRFNYVLQLRGEFCKPLAYRLGYQHSTLLDWAKGKYFPRLPAIVDIAQALRVSPAWLAFGEGDME